MAKLNRVTAKALSQFSQNNHLLAKHPMITRDELKIRTIGKALTDLEWERFRSKLLTPKMREFCERKHDGTGSVTFCGQMGIEAALVLQEKFAGRFHFSIHCDKQQTTAIAIAAAKNIGLDITEAHYVNGLNETINITDKKLMNRMLDSIAM